ncbi:MAG: hypothetical protein WA581_09450 [Candidatus Acidiferrales bacterium]
MRKPWSVFCFVLLAVSPCYIAGASRAAASQNADMSAQAPCDKQCLTDLVKQYLEALLKHDLSTLPLAGSVRFTENRKQMPLGDGLSKTVSAIPFRGEVVADPVSSQVVFFGAVKEGSATDLFTVRLRAVGRKIGEIETLVYRPSPTAPMSIDIHPDLQLLAIMKPFFESALLPSERRDRATLLATANSYFEGIEQHTASIVPFADGCNRVENGQMTTNNPNNARLLSPTGCAEQFNAQVFTHISKVRERRIMIADVDRGLVAAYVFLDVPGTQRTRELNGRTVAELPQSMKPRSNFLGPELFKVQAGQIRLIQAFMLPSEPFGARSGW